jgi:hypothetical protein
MKGKQFLNKVISIENWRMNKKDLVTFVYSSEFLPESVPKIFYSCKKRLSKLVDEYTKVKEEEGAMGREKRWILEGNMLLLLVV